MTLPKFLTSSVNPEQLSLTIKGFIVGIIPVVVIVSGAMHWNLGQQDLTTFADATANFVTAVGSVCSAFMILFGIARKIGVATGLIKPQQ